jgi:hypothetical protein
MSQGDGGIAQPWKPCQWGSLGMFLVRKLPSRYTQLTVKREMEWNNDGVKKLWWKGKWSAEESGIHLVVYFQALSSAVKLRVIISIGSWPERLLQMPIQLGLWKILHSPFHGTLLLDICIDQSYCEKVSLWEENRRIQHEHWMCFPTY